MNIYVGNISYNATEESLRASFEEFGEVDQVKVIADRETGRSRGFAFVEMPNDQEAEKAIEALNGKQVDDREMKVSQARPKSDNRRGGQDSRRY